MAERRTFREKARDAARKSSILLEKLNPERAVSRIRLNLKLARLINSKYDNDPQPLDWERLKELIVSGADVNTRAGFGKTPLMFAAYSGRTDICVFLLANGADIDIKDGTGRTAQQQLFGLVPLSKHEQEWKEITELFNCSKPLSNLLGKEEFKAFLPNFAECAGLN
ncbi:MAG: ankyrin repeat domain-containing protein [Candidatus Micrarchaeota archaeon]|nr:ankyrin repeat domain-containing protein [Candidatus Micrarchaeota archaeon]